LGRDRVEALPIEPNDARALDGSLTVPSATYELVKGDLHRHGTLRHAHPHTDPQRRGRPDRDPPGIAFALRSQRAERLAGLVVVAAIFISACVAAFESILRLLHPSTPGHLLALVLAGAIGFAGNRLAALVRSRAGRRLESHALIADGDHARADAYVSLAVIASAIAIAAGAPILDPIIGLGMTAVILRITRESWRTVRGHAHRH
jgi:hypothetical protein